MSSASESCGLTVPLQMFSSAAEITNFISPQHTHRGIGQKMLDSSWKCQNDWVAIILASIYSPNSPSVAFYKKNEFVE